MEFDPYLYVAFAAGYLAGRLYRPRGPWIGGATFATILVLVGLLGASLAPTPLPALLGTIPLALLLVAILLGVTILLSRLLPHREGAPPRIGEAVPRTSLALGAALLVGFGAGRAAPVLPYGTLITAALYLLLFLVAFDLRFSREAVRTVATPLVAAIGGALVAAIAVAFLTGTGLRLLLASTFGFGWYTLAGPLVATRLGAAAGLLAFLTNFLRENLTMGLAPVLGPRAGPETLTAMGGATTMDTTLYFVTRYGHSEAGSLALASGLVLTVLASLLLPVLLALPSLPRP